jgi:hypothetical protein
MARNKSYYEIMRSITNDIAPVSLNTWRKSVQYKSYRYGQNKSVTNVVTDCPNTIRRCTPKVHAF